MSGVCNVIFKQIQWRLLIRITTLSEPNMRDEIMKLSPLSAFKLSIIFEAALEVEIIESSLKPNYLNLIKIVDCKKVNQKLK